MKNNDKGVRVAIVGFGPRGLGALEALLTQTFEALVPLSIDIFDPCDWPGAGPNYDPTQGDECILNIPLRSLDIDPPDFLAKSIGSFADWSTARYDPDDFPPRADIGAYFHARYQALSNTLKGQADICHNAHLVTGLERIGSDWFLMTAGKRFGPYDEVLLTQGQPATAPDPQLKRWHEHAVHNSLELLPAYPAKTVIAAASNWTEKTVAIRGLGLSTFDVLRMLTTGLGGTFQGAEYRPSGKEPHKILPFSLNGRPPAPKPANEALDHSFDASEEETLAFKQALATAFSATTDDPVKILCDALVAPASRILAEKNSDRSTEDVRLWLEFEREHAGAQEYLGAFDTLEESIEMSYGRIPPGVGYVVSQIWRKWEGLTRSAFNAAKLATNSSASIVDFDENLKRYSAGPPVSSSEELMALVNCGIVSLCTVDDPAIILTPQGWHLSDGDDALKASVMIDAVLPSPDIANVTDDLTLSALEQGLVRQLSQGRGLATTQDGQLVDRDGELQLGLSALGRMALGSVMAVDSLHDCFGETSANWAAGVLERTASRTS